MLGSLLVIVFAAVHSALVCDLGKFGQNCDRPCSEECGLFTERNLRPCHKDTGACLQGCVRGRHGDHCDKLCSHNCINTTCNQGTGECTIGCTDGYIGYFCNKTGTQIQTSGTQIQTSGTQIQTTGTQIQTTGGRIQTTGTQIQTSGTQIQTTGTQIQTAGTQIQTTCGRIQTAGWGHIRHRMHWMLMLPVAIFIISTIRCLKKPRCRRRFDKGLLWLIIRCRRSSSSDPSQDPLLSTASNATLSQAGRDLYFATGVGDLEKVKRLLSQGVDANCRVGGGCWTPVMEAAYKGHRKVVELLVSRGAYVSLVDVVGDNILHCACRGGDLETVRFVLSQNVVDINSRGRGKRTPVMAAAYVGHREVVELLVSKGAYVSLVNEYGNNILHLACWGGDVETVEFLLSLNVADINSRGQESRTPVMAAAYKGHREVVELLVSKGADVSLVNEYGNNILHVACRRGDVETVKYVLSLNVVDIDARNMWGETAADVARSEGRQRVVELLKSRGAQ